MTSPNAAFGVFLVVFLLYFIACWPISMLARYLKEMGVMFMAENIIECKKNLTKKFEGHTILDGMDLEIKTR